MALTIHCTKCQRRTQAERCTIPVKVRGHNTRVWGNRCLDCGTAHETMPPSAAPARAAERRARAAGQLDLFGKGRPR
jgi:hypothetical protein